MELVEFIKKFGGQSFKPARWQEEIIEMLDKGQKIITLPHGNSGYRWYKRLSLDYFSTQALEKMKPGENFALASLDGVRVFQMVEFRANNACTRPAFGSGTDSESDESAGG